MYWKQQVVFLGDLFQFHTGFPDQCLWVDRWGNFCSVPARFDHQKAKWGRRQTQPQGECVFRRLLHMQVSDVVRSHGSRHNYGALLFPLINGSNSLLLGATVLCGTKTERARSFHSNTLDLILLQVSLCGCHTGTKPSLFPVLTSIRHLTTSALTSWRWNITSGKNSFFCVPPRLTGLQHPQSVNISTSGCWLLFSSHHPTSANICQQIAVFFSVATTKVKHNLQSEFSERKRRTERLVWGCWQGCQISEERLMDVRTCCGARPISLFFLARILSMWSKVFTQKH